jgi:membrane protein YdbS with pleckstrin-like domain
MRQLEPAIQRVWRIYGFITIAVIAIILFPVEWFWLSDALGLPAGLWTGLTLLPGIILCIALPPIFYRHWSYELTEDELYLEHGMFTRVRSIVPLRRVQHLDISQDVLEGEFDLASLIVYTAGTASSSVAVPGLAVAEAERLRDEVRRHIREEQI